MTSRSSTSEHLDAVATDAFHSHVLPAIQAELPGIENEITVLVTSSVAYGSADTYSDLDVFIIFRRDHDYRRFATTLELVIDALDLEALYGDVCDKGVRFELESLQRSDLAGLFFHPSDESRWHRQTAWLLSWFLSSKPIHDPRNVWQTMHRRCGTFPPAIRQRREQTARLAIRRWATTAAATAAQESSAPWTFPGLRATWRALAACLDAAYVTGGVYAPHPKWRQPLADRLITDRRARDLLNAFETTAAVALGERADGTQSALTDLIAASNKALPLAAGAAWEPLTETCWPVHDGKATTWIQHDWTPGALATLDQSVTHEDIYLWHELGAHLVNRKRWDYDAALRVSDRLRWFERHATGVPPIPAERAAVRRRRLRYLHFLIWRKIRVVEKAAKRDQPFNAVWYALQVVEHLLELHARLADDFLPPETQTDAFTTLGGQNLHPLEHGATPVEDPHVILRATRPGNELVQWAWKEFRALQKQLLAAGTITPAEADDPLPTQFEVQYWKYENLFV